MQIIGNRCRDFFIVAVSFGVSQVLRPALTQSGQMFLFIPVPGIFLIVFLLHLASVRGRWNELVADDLMKALKSASASNE